MGRRLREGLALVLTMSLGLVVVSSLWHHDHSRTVINFSRGNHHTAHTPASHSADYCPVCLSHRLLTYTCLQAAVEAPSPVVSSDCPPAAATVPAATFAFHSEARAPPLC